MSFEKAEPVPLANEIDISPFLDRDVFGEMLDLGLIGQKEYDLWSPDFPNLQSALNDKGRPLHRAIGFGRKNLQKLTDFISINYGFLPEWDWGTSEATPVEQLTELDENVAAALMDEIDYSSIPITQATAEKFQEAGILTLGDYLTMSNVKQKELTKSQPVKLALRAYAKDRYGIDAEQLRRNPSIVTALGFKYALLKRTSG